MSSRLRGRTVALLALLLATPLQVAAASPATTAPSAAAASPATLAAAAPRRAAGSLRVSPAHYIGGQRITFAGDLGVPGRRRVKLQLNLSRPGDPWNDVNGFKRRWTRADGTFRFRYLAPAMFGMQMRVVSGRHRTTPIEFHAASQELVVDVRAGTPGLADGQVVAGESFSLAVDTTPEGGSDLARRTDLPPPAFPGRGLSLQQRGSNGTWVDVATDAVSTDARGHAAFEGLTLPLSADGTVYRVVQEAWTKGRSRIGWYPSFPVYVDVLAPSEVRTAQRAATAPSARGVALAGASQEAGSLMAVSRDVASKTAAERFQWRPSLWDFGWTYGESLTDRPSRGDDRVGHWVEWSDGTGRSAKHNGGLMLDSQRQNKDGYGQSVGTTMVTMQGNPMARGRWEVRLRMKSTEKQHRDLPVLIELVPEDAAPRCRATGITIAEASPHERGITVGVRNAQGTEWRRTEPGISVNGTSHAVAVEVTRRHISWFVEGELVGTVTDRAAIPDVPLTLRLSLQGQGTQQVDRTQAIFDWMRGYSLDRGRTVAGGVRLERGEHDLYC